jgi:antirestriction protein ArdC
MAKVAELYQAVTDRIVADLEKGVKPWTQPWKGSTAGNGKPVLPCNLATGRAYSGVNTLILWAETMGRGYPTHQWVTFKQANDMGGRVRQGEKSVPVIFTKWIEEEKDGKVQKVPVVRWFYVFNRAQLSGIDSIPEPEPMSPQIANAAAIMDKSGIPVVRGHTKAFYDIAADTIYLPDFKAFSSGEAYLRTAFHEAIHGTGHQKRLNREFGKRFGDSRYAMEELVAELGAAFLCARTNLAYASENAEYIGAWVAKMKEDNRVIFRASSHASQAAEWLYNRAFAPAERVETDLAA